MARGMLLLLGIVVVFYLPFQSEAFCPNGCNHRGKCTANDRCQCFTRRGSQNEPAYVGPDCGGFTCPKGEAWVSKATAFNSAHDEVECSNVGYCDRTTGTCQCKAGFTGKACQRMDAANANFCNNRGVWVSEKSLAASLASSNGYAYQGWAENVLYGCQCDVGYRGHDCSLVECPTGNDPLGGPGKTSGRDCSGRGKCDYTTGTCICAEGFDGQACAEQSYRF